MRITGRFQVVFGLLILAAPLCAGPDVPSTRDEALLDRVQESAATVFSTLRSFVCDERIDRYRGALDGSRERPLDTVHAKLSFEDGTEQYSDIWQNGQARPTIASLSGAWSEGEFGSLLKQTVELLRIERLNYLGAMPVDGETTAVYAFQTPAEDSPWELAVDGRVYRVAFYTQVYIGRDSQRITRIVRTAVNVPAATGISALEWTVSLSPTILNGSEWWLPVAATYDVSYGSYNRREWNRITFEHYRRYGSTAELRFDH